MMYQAKLLLIGEHSINRGSNALAVPFAQRGGRWVFSDPSDARDMRQQDLPVFAAWLAEQQGSESWLAELDAARFMGDLAAGLYFKSTIPSGYGMGSSGALCAAVYDRYARHPIKRDEQEAYALLRRQLAQIESFFHGSSSGTDPLICYLQQAVLLAAEGRIEVVAIPPAPAETGFFLLDTGIPRRTGPLVEGFLRKCEIPSFAARLSEVLVPKTNRAIDSLLRGRWAELFDHLHALSTFQLDELPELIPAAFHAIWREALETSALRLKLCGAGGGGFLLGYSLHLPEALAWLRMRRLDPLVVQW